MLLTVVLACAAARVVQGGAPGARIGLAPRPLRSGVRLSNSAGGLLNLRGGASEQLGSAFTARAPGPLRSGVQLGSGVSSSAGRLLDLRGGAIEGIPELRSERGLEVALEDAGNALVVIDFFAEWCGPCKQLAPKLAELAKKHAGSKKVLFYQVNVDEARPLASAMGITSMPTVHFWRGGKKVREVVGADLAAIRSEVAAATSPALMRVLSTPWRVLQKDGAIAVPLLAAYLLVPWDRLGLQA